MSGGLSNRVQVGADLFRKRLITVEVLNKLLEEIRREEADLKARAEILTDRARSAAEA